MRREQVIIIQRWNDNDTPSRLRRIAGMGPAEAMVLTSDQCEVHSCIIVIMADTWFTSDFHLGHFNIIRYCNRPFADTREMDEVIVDRLNAVVKPNDTLYFLGDFCLGKHDNVAAYRNRLSCQTIHFIDGNHDKTTRQLQHLFSSWSSLSEISIGKQGIVLCHYAMKVWPNHSRGAWQLYGHSHGNLLDDPISLSMDVGVDSHEFRPWHFDEIQAVMRVKSEAKAAHIEKRNAALKSAESPESRELI